jgi:hypothetical protein
MFGQYGSLRRFCRMVLFCLVLGLGLAACGNSGGTGGNSSTPTTVPLKVMSVDVTVGPSLNGQTCGSPFTETYTATFHFPANHAGGPVQFQYTTDNGRGSTPASLTVPAGQTSATYQFTWSGQLPADHTAPGNGGIMVNSPNSLTSQMVAPSGSCTTVAPSAFQVTSVEISTSPSLNGHTCGSQFTEVYTATFHLAPNGPGGTIVFQYTTDNGRGTSPNVSLPVAAGQTSATYQFTWSGQLPADHTAPGPGGVMVSSPNALTSPLVAPSGSCSTGTPSAFQVTKMELSASPSLTGQACGTQFTETYTAVFHIAPNGPGGTIVFQYTTDNGRSNSPSMSLHVAAGQTTATYQFTWSGKLPADHTAPGIGIVLMSAPNQGESPAAIPSGTCS